MHVPENAIAERSYFECFILFFNNLLLHVRICFTSTYKICCNITLFIHLLVIHIYIVLFYFHKLLYIYLITITCINKFFWDSLKITGYKSLKI